MKIFIANQRADSAIAESVGRQLRVHHSIDSYLDVIDTNLYRNGEALGEYLRREMRKCTQLIAVVSHSTTKSWWVPWEIGVATEKEFPLATFLGDDTALPEYLQKCKSGTTCAPFAKSISMRRHRRAQNAH